MKDLIKTRTNEITLLSVFVVLFAVMAGLSPDKFLRWRNLQSMLYQMPEFGLIALGMMAIIVTGGINLSIVSSAALSGIISAMVLSSSLSASNPALGIILAIIACFTVAALTGVLNGVVVAYVGVVPMLTTLGTMIFFEGISLNFTKGGAISGFPEAFSYIGTKSILGIPVPMIIYAASVVATYLLLERSKWGAEVYMTGCNPVATRFSGINTKKVLIWVYIYSSLMAGLSAIIMISRYNSAKVDYGSSYMMQSIAAVVLGGTSISGGSGTVAGTLIAVAIIQVISNGLNIFGVNRYLVDISTGVILLAVLALRFLNTKVNLNPFKMIKSAKP